MNENKERSGKSFLYFRKMSCGVGGMKNRYQKLGIALCSTGVIVAPVSYFIIDSIPLTAVGISAFSIGISCFVLAYNHSSLSPEAYRLMLTTGLKNTAALLEGLGVSGKAVYLPSTMRNGNYNAFIPLTQGGDGGLMKEKILEKFLVPYGKNHEDLAFSLATPGGINIDSFETIPGPTAGEIEFAINHILSEILDVADSASVILLDNRVYVAVSNPKLVFEDTRYYQCMGSPIASIIAAVSSEALGRPIRILEENREKELSTITLEVLP
jgi:hypothetical protein